MILAVGNVKGGVGKTTLAVNLTIALSLKGRNVLLVDTTDSRHADGFTGLRTEKKGSPGYTVMILQGNAIRTEILHLAGKYSDIVFDVGGDTTSFRAALTVADTILIPVQASLFDLWAVTHTADLVRAARYTNKALRAICVLNAADKEDDEDNAAVAKYVAEIEGTSIELAPGMIARNDNFLANICAGESVLEDDDPEAIEDLTRLTTFLFPALASTVAEQLPAEVRTAMKVLADLGAKYGVPQPCSEEA